MKIMKTYWWSFAGLILYHRLLQAEDALLDQYTLHIVIVRLNAHLTQLIIFGEVAHCFDKVHILCLFLVHRQLL